MSFSRVVVGAAAAALLACGEPAPLADAESPSARLRAAIARSEATLLGSDYAKSSPDARRASEAYLAGLVASAWDLAGAATLLETPSLRSQDGLGGFPGLYNPDNLYQSALLDPHGSYRITGRRGTHLQLVLQVVDAYPVITLGQSRAVIDLDALGVAPGEPFELWLGGAERPGRWFPLAEDAKALFVRQTFADWERETPSELRLERLDRPPLAAPASRLALAADYLESATDLWTGSLLLRLKLVPDNDLSAPAPTRDGLPGQLSSIGHFALGPGEALLVRVPASAARYQAIQIGDPWFVTPDWVRHLVSLNRSQSRADADGQLRYVISPTDPGVPNWIDTAGNSEGYVFLRWQGIAGELRSAQAPSAERVKLADLRASLPPDTPHVDAAERAQQLAARRNPPGRR